MNAQKLGCLIMYFAHTIKERIKLLCRKKKINMETLLSECSLGVNAIRQITDTKGMASFSLAKIADYLDCSVDYLLGRTENSQSHKKESVNKYNSLSALGQQKADAYIDDLLVNPKYRKENQTAVQNPPAREIAAYGADGTKGTFTKRPREIT